MPNIYISEKGEDSANRSLPWACEFCGSRGTPVYDVRLGDRRTSLYNCWNCLSFQTETPFSESEVRRYYEEKYFAGSAWEINKARSLAADYLRKLERTSASEPFRKRSLEIGAGYGFFSQQLERRGIVVDVVEPNRGCREFIKLGGFGGNIFESLEAVPAALRYGEVFCLHVVEHLLRFGDFLERIAQVLEPGGRLWILTPHAESNTFKRFQRRWGWACPDQHYQFLSARIPESYYQVYGFQLLKAEDIQPAVIHYPSCWLTIILNRFGWLQKVGDNWSGWRRKCRDKILRGLNGCLRKALGQNRTNYNFCVAEKIWASMRHARPYDELLLVTRRSRKTP
jgi:SAM-dependent methyltransferase